MKVKNIFGITGLATLVLLFFAAAMTSCSSDEFEENEAPVQQEMIKFTATVGEKGADAIAEAKAAMGGTRALSESGSNINATWAVGEEIAIVFNSTKYTATVTAVASNGCASIEGTVPAATPDNQAVQLIYPASAVTDAGAIKDNLLAQQLGTLADVSANYDVITANGNLEISGTSASMKEQVTFNAPQYTICKFQFTENNTAITGITQLVIKDNTDNVITTVTPASALDVVYVAMAPITSRIKFALKSGSNTYYTGSANAQLAAGKYYPIGLNLSQLDYQTYQDQAAVDLGMTTASGKKLIWASMNVGAVTETVFGDYFAWGATEPWYSSLDPLTWKDGKTGYNWASYHYGTLGSRLTKYNTNSSNGTVDNKTTLEATDDAAAVNIGGDWRMPTAAEFQELLDNTTSTLVTNYKGSGINGYTFTGNGNTIFLPAAGYRHDTNLLQGTTGDYWSSSLYESAPYLGLRLYFGSGYVYVDYGLSRYNGLSVRAVKEVSE